MDKRSGRPTPLLSHACSKSVTRSVLLLPVSLPPPSSPFSFPPSLSSLSLRQPEAIFRGVVEVVETVERLVDVGCITKADLVRAREGGGEGGGEGKVGWTKGRGGEAGERETGCLIVVLTDSRSKLSRICLSFCFFLSNFTLSPCPPPPSVPFQVRVPVAPDGSMLPSLPPIPPGMGLDDDAQGAHDLIPRRM
jgi:hypothetical protein